MEQGLEVMVLRKQIEERQRLSEDDPTHGVVEVQKELVRDNKLED